ncbi:major facilitator superfamily transporter protein [Rutstroemia sp. NJR-2017a BVV2]|nr:major facilitator superfamily transporter protein [Rutstroemia sp. NJR-2017a BVV2]
MSAEVDFEKDEIREFNHPHPAFATATSSITEHAGTPRPASHADSISSLSESDHSNSDPLAPLEQALTPNLETIEEQLAHAQLSYTKTGTSYATTGSRIPSFEVDFTADDPDDPRNWPTWYRGCIIGAVSLATWTVVLYSSSYTSSMPGMMEEFNVTSEPVATLGVTTYLLGLAVGSLILAPLSEIWGRRPVYIGSLAFFCLMVLPCALSTSLGEVLGVRFIGALAGAAMISNSPGSVSDITTEQYRALAFSIWSIGPMNGPVTGPLIGGFAAEYLGWRWTNWIVMMLAGAAFFACAFIKETYAPVILKQKAAKMRKETGDERYWCKYDEKKSFLQILKINLSRPFVLSFTEPILWFWNTYIAIIYGILYLCFVAYPIIYTDLRGWSLGQTGLAFLGIGLGTMLSIVTEPLIRRMINSHKIDPETGKVPPEASTSIICIAAFLCPIGQLWFSWTCVPITIHWIWPILAGVPFGAGNTLVFIYASNYLAGSYGIYSASALAGNSVVRSIVGGTLPLAGPAMYGALTPQWAGTLLGLVQVLLIPIPFIFYKWGSQIRAKSPLIRQMREDQEKAEKRNARAKKREEKKAVGDRGQVLMSDGNDVEKGEDVTTGEVMTGEK